MAEYFNQITPGAIPCNEQKLSNYLPSFDSPDENKWADCVHCGMCLDSCPTFQELGEEHQSPRGRVHLIKSVAEGKVALDEDFMDPIFTCLDCRACETACPANVQVGGLIEEARGQIRHAMPPSGISGVVQNFFLRGVFPHPHRLHALGGALEFLRKSGLQTVARKIGLMKLFPSHIQAMETILPQVQTPVMKKYPKVVPTNKEKKATIAFFTGCIMDVMFADVNEATIRVLNHNGYEVEIPREQRCCGALHIHAGDREEGKRLAKLNIEAFNDGEHIIINSAGCGCALKEYPELFQNDREWHTKAEAFSAKVEDVTKFLFDHGFEKPQGEVKAKVTYHDACHLAHGQGIREEPRRLLKEIPGVEMVDLPYSDRCCGSAGIYNLTQPEMAGALLDRKVNDLPEDIDLISMGNPGCMLQIAMGVMKHGRNGKVIHTIQLLDQSYQKVETSRGASDVDC